MFERLVYLLKSMFLGILKLIRVRRKIRVAGGILLLFLGGMVFIPHVRAVTVDELIPHVTVYSTVQKDIIDLDNVTLYTDDGVNRSLGFNINAEENISLNTYNIIPCRQFENESIADGTASYTSPYVSNINYALLYDLYSAKYLLIAGDISSTSTSYNGIENSIKLTCGVDVSQAEYIAIAYKFIETYTNITALAGQVKIIALDEGGEDHLVTVKFGYLTTSVLNIGDLDGDGKSDDVRLYYVTADATTITNTPQILQLAWQDLAQQLLNVRFIKVVSIIYGYYAIIGAGSGAIKIAYRYVLFNDNIFKMNNIIVNASTLQFKATDKITSTIKIKKIVDAQIPIKKELKCKPSGDPDSNVITYQYKFSLPDDSALSFSNTYVNLTLPSYEGFSIDNVTEFWIDTEDKLDMLQNYEAGDELTIMSSVDVGNLHIIELKIKYSEEHYNTIMYQGVGFVFFITHPIEAFYFVLGSIIAIIAVTLKWRSGKETGEKLKAKGAPKKGLREL